MANQEDSYLIFKSWISPDFLANDQSANPLNAGIRTALLGSLWIIAITFLLAFPIGVGSAIYLEEYAEDTKLNRLLQLNIFNLSAVPSIIYGLLGLAVFVRAMEGVTSGALFSSVADTTANGRTILSGGLTLGLLVLPIIIINTQEALKGVPDSLRMSSYGVGATKWQTIWSQVLPVSFDRILTGTILALSRALGETAPLVVIGLLRSSVWTLPVSSQSLPPCRSRSTNGRLVLRVLTVTLQQQPSLSCWCFFLC